MMARIGVIGLGNMGAGIARNVGGDGGPVAVWDASQAARRRFENQEGFRLVPPGAMAAACDVILFVVPATPEIEQCLDEPDGIAARARPGLVLVDLTTSDPAETRRVAARLAEKGIAYIDAAMSGGKAGAEAGSLTLMVGGNAEAYARVEPVLKLFAKSIYYLGASGAGHTMKLVHQIMCHANFLAACEAFALGERAGLNLSAMVEVVNASNGRSYASEVRFPRHILSETWDGGSRVYNLHKDLAMAVGLAHANGGGARFAEATLAYLQQAVDRGMAEQDFTLLYQDFEALSPHA